MLATNFMSDEFGFSEIEGLDRLLFQAEILSQAALEKIHDDMYRTANDTVDIDQKDLQSYLAIIRSLNQAIADSYASGEAGAAVGTLSRSIASMKATIQNYKGGAIATRDLRNKASTFENSLKQASNNSGLDASTRFMLRNNLQQLQKTNVSTPNIRNATIHSLVKRTTVIATPRVANDGIAIPVLGALPQVKGGDPAATVQATVSTTTPVANLGVTPSGPTTTTMLTAGTAPAALTATTLQTGLLGVAVTAPASPLVPSTTPLAGNLAGMTALNTGIPGANPLASVLAVMPVGVAAMNGIVINARDAFRQAGITATTNNFSGTAQIISLAAHVQATTHSRSIASVEGVTAPVAANDAKSMPTASATVTATPAVTPVATTPAFVPVVVTTDPGVKGASVTAPTSVTTNDVTTRESSKSAETARSQSEPARALDTNTPRDTSTPEASHPPEQPKSLNTGALREIGTLETTRSLEQPRGLDTNTPRDTGSPETPRTAEPSKGLDTGTPQNTGTPEAPRAVEPVRNPDTSTPRDTGTPETMRSSEQPKGLDTGTSRDTGTPEAPRSQNVGEINNTAREQSSRQENNGDNNGLSDRHRSNNESMAEERLRSAPSFTEDTQRNSDVGEKFRNTNEQITQQEPQRFEEARIVALDTTSSLPVEQRLQNFKEEFTAFKEQHGADYKNAPGYKELMDKREKLLDEKRKNQNPEPTKPCGQPLGPCPSTCHC